MSSSLFYHQQEIEKRLSFEYNTQRPIYEKIVAVAKPQIEHALININFNKKRWGRVEVIARIKDFVSAVDKIRKKRDGNLLYDSAFLSELNDMVGLKIRVFPNNYLNDVQKIIEKLFPGFTEDHYPKHSSGSSEKEYYNNVDRLKYFVRLDSEFQIETMFEIQIVPFVLDSFMGVEHSITYKPDESLPKTIVHLIKEENIKTISALKGWSAKVSDFLK